MFFSVSREVVLAFFESSFYSYVRRRDFYAFRMAECQRVVVRENIGKRKKCIDLWRFIVDFY